MGPLRRRASLVSIGGSVVECSPATRAARVRFPADALLAGRRRCCAEAAARPSLQRFTPRRILRGHRASVAQWLARSAVNRKVGGSTPPGALYFEGRRLGLRTACTC